MAYSIPVIDITGEDDRPDIGKVGPIKIIFTSDSELGTDHDNKKSCVENKTQGNNFQEQPKPGRMFENHASTHGGVSSQSGDNKKCYTNQYGPNNRRHCPKQRQLPNEYSPIRSLNCCKGEEIVEDNIDRSCYDKREKEVESNSLLFSSESYTDRSERVIDECSVYKENLRIDGEYGGFVVIYRADVPADEYNEYLESQQFSRSGSTGRRSFCFIL